MARHSAEELSAIMREVELDFGREIGAEYYESLGACGFLTCLETESHRHAICPKCEAVKFGNLYCYTCREYQDRVTKRLEEVEGGDGKAS